MAWFTRRRPSPSDPRSWRLGSWDAPDLSYFCEFAASRHGSWELYLPHLELVPCGDELKPALCFTVGAQDFRDWSEAVELRTARWETVSHEGVHPYVFVRLTVLFRNPRGNALGIGGAGRVYLSSVTAVENSHQFRGQAYFDPVDQAHANAITAWATHPAPTVLFFVEEGNTNRSFMWLDIRPEGKQVALDALAKAQHDLAATPNVEPGTFADAVAATTTDLPARSWWHDA